jgi:hypothetical protein
MHIGLAIRVPQQQPHGPPFDPSAIGSLVWDLDADAGITYGAGGSGVGLVASIVGSVGPAAAQATDAKQPLRIAADAHFNGHNSIDHTTTDSGLVISSSLGIRHVFAVASYPATTFAGYNNLLSHLNFSNVWQGSAGTGDWYPDNIAGTHYRDGSASGVTALSAANDPHVHEMVLDALETSSSWMVGASALLTGRQWAGRWTRLIAFNAPVTGTDLTNLLAYLKARYGTP